MHPSIFLLSTLVTGIIIEATPLQATKRDLQVIDVTPPPPDADANDPSNSDDSKAKRSLFSRSYPYKTGHCGENGGQWMPLIAVNPTDNGFNDASTAFCGHFDGTVIPGDGSVSALVQSTGGENLRLTDGSIGHFQGTIYCKKNHQCTVAASTCQEYMLAIGAVGSQCYGKNHKDTKGGRNTLTDSYYSATPLEGAGT